MKRSERIVEDAKRTQLRNMQLATASALICGFAIGLLVGLLLT